MKSRHKNRNLAAIEAAAAELSLEVGDTLTDYAECISSLKATSELMSRDDDLYDVSRLLKTIASRMSDILDKISGQFGDLLERSEYRAGDLS